MCQVICKEGGELMYSNILNVKFSEIRKKFVKFDSVDAGKRIITLTNLEGLDTVSNDSDIIVYYNVMENTTPVMLVERVSTVTVQEKQVRAMAELFNQENKEYVASVKRVKKTKKAGDYLDILVVRRRVYENLQSS